VGLFTRYATRVAFALGFFLLSLPHCFGKTHHFDASLVLVMGVLAFSRAGDAFSLDRLRSRREASTPDPTEYVWPIRAAWVICVLVFTAAGIAKLRHGGLAWFYPVNLANKLLVSQHHAANADPLTSWGVVVARHPWMCTTMAIGTVVTEVGFSLVVLGRWYRVVFVPGITLLLVGIRVLMGPTFESFAAPLSFFVPWAALFDRIRRLAVR
jgi:hypothetical protein